MLKFKKLNSMFLAFVLVFSMVSYPSAQVSAQGMTTKNIIFEYDFESDNGVPFSDPASLGAPAYVWSVVTPISTGGNKYTTKTIPHPNKPNEKVLEFKATEGIGNIGRIIGPSMDLTSGITVVEGEFSTGANTNFATTQIVFNLTKLTDANKVVNLAHLRDNDGLTMKYMAIDTYNTQLFYQNADSTYTAPLLRKNEWGKFKIVMEPISNADGSIAPLMTLYVNGRKTLVQSGTNYIDKRTAKANTALRYDDLALDIRFQGDVGDIVLFDNLSVWKADALDYSIPAATGVKVYNDLELTFSHDVDIDTVTTNNITVSAGGVNAPIASIVKDYSNPTKATIKFDGNLIGETTYTVDVSGVKDIFGNSTAKQITFVTDRYSETDEAILRILNEKDPVSLKNLVETNADLLSIDMTEYNTLISKDALFNTILNKYTYSTIEQFEQAFYQEVKVKAIKEDINVLDGYTAETSDVFGIKPKPWYAVFSENVNVKAKVLTAIQSAEFTCAQEFIPLFEKNCILLGIANGTSVETENIISGSASTIGVSLTSYNNLSAENKNTVINLIAGKTYTDYAQLAADFNLAVGRAENGGIVQTKNTLFAYDFESDMDLPFSDAAAIGAPEYVWSNVYPNGKGGNLFTTKTVPHPIKPNEKVLEFKATEGIGNVGEIVGSPMDISNGKKTVMEVEFSPESFAGNNQNQIITYLISNSKVAYMAHLRNQDDPTGMEAYISDAKKSLLYKDGENYIAIDKIPEKGWGKYTIVIDPKMNGDLPAPETTVYVNGRKGYYYNGSAYVDKHTTRVVTGFDYKNAQVFLRFQGDANGTVLYDNVEVWQTDALDYKLEKDTNVNVYESIKINFSNPVDLDTVLPENIAVCDAEGMPAAIASVRKSYSNQKQAVITFAADLKENTQFTVDISGVKDIVGNSTDRKVTFTTSAALTSDKIISETISIKDPVDLKAHIERFYAELGMDLSEVNALSNPPKVYENVVNDTYSTLEEFKNLFAKETKVCKFREDISALDSYLSESTDVLGVKSQPYYSLLTDTIKPIVISRLENASYSCYTEFMDAFAQAAVLTAMENAANTYDLEQIIISQKDITGVDLTDYNKLLQTEKDNVLTALLNKNFSSFKAFSEQFSVEVIIQSSSKPMKNTAEVKFEYDFENDENNGMLPFTNADAEKPGATGVPPYVWGGVFPTGDSGNMFTTNTVADIRNAQNNTVQMESTTTNAGEVVVGKLFSSQIKLSEGITVLETEFSPVSFAGKDDTQILFALTSSAGKGATYLGHLRKDDVNGMVYYATNARTDLYVKNQNGQYVLPDILREGEWAKFTIVIEPTLVNGVTAPTMSFYINGKKAYVTNQYLEKYAAKENAQLFYDDLAFDLRFQGSVGVKAAFDNVKVYKINPFDWELASNELLVDETVKINFSNDMDLDTIRNNSIVVKDRNGTIIPIAEIRKDYSNLRQVEAVFGTNLNADSAYIVQLDGVKDIGGNTTDKRLAFTTVGIENPGFIVSEPHYYIGADEIFALTNGTVTVKTTYTSTLSEAVNANLIVALYKGKKLVGYKDAAIDVQPNETAKEASCSIDIGIPIGEEGYTLKSFVWKDDTNSLKPLSKGFILNQ